MIIVLKNRIVNLFLNIIILFILIVMAIGKKIRKARRMADITQEELSAKAKITKETLYKIEKEITDPKWSTVVKIASALNISLDSLR